MGATRCGIYLIMSSIILFVSVTAFTSTFRLQSRGTIMNTSKTVHTNFFQVQTKCSSSYRRNHLFMSSLEEGGDGSGEAETNEEEITKSIKSKSSDKTSTPNKNKKNSFASLVLVPTLIAKFAIVILVKIMTDLVVFPLLALFRLLKWCKDKVFSLFKKNGPGGQEQINGA